MKFVTHCFFFSFFIFLSGCHVKSTKEESTLNIKNFNETNHILLTNEAHFKKSSSLYGASSFVIDYQGTIYAVTAKHLIGEAGGVEPEIKPLELSDEMTQWKMFPRVKNSIFNDSVIIDKTKYKEFNTGSDILLLRIKAYKGKLCQLKPVLELPKENDSLFIIGCPYSEENCRQNIYPCVYSFYDAVTKQIVCDLKGSFELPGFSGAPIINKQGQVVAVLIGAMDYEGGYKVFGTYIHEIDKIKY